jgi:hypothetical protein
MNVKIKKILIVIAITILVTTILVTTILGMPLRFKSQEGFDATALATNMEWAMNEQLAKAGFPPIDLNSSGNLFDMLRELMQKETDIVQGKQDTTIVAENNRPVNNTLEPDLTLRKSFLYGEKFGDAFCSQNSGTPTNLNNKCGALTEDSCNTTNCCVWLNGKQCVAGNINGPGGNGVSDTDYYLYKYQCYGNKCEGGDPCLKYKSTDKNLPDNCLTPMWKKAGCTEPILGTAWWKTQEKKVVINDMGLWAVMPDYTHRVACYSANQSKWPTLDERYRKVVGNNGTVSCTEYCNKATGGKLELPNKWKGAICAAAGPNNENDCSYAPGTSATNLQCICQRNDSTPWVA